MPNGKGSANKKNRGRDGSKNENNKLTRFDPRNVKGNIELFQHINEIQSLKYRKMFEQSESLKVKKKKRAKYANIVEDFGIKIVNEEEEEFIRESPRLLGGHSELPDAFKSSVEGRMMQLSMINDEEEEHNDY